MRKSISRPVIVICAIALTVGVRFAAGQTAEMSVKYLKAGMGTIPLRGDVIVVGQYVTTPGMQDTGWRYGGTPQSQFSVRSPKSSVTFDMMYAEEGSAAFKTLLDAKPEQVFRFSGFKAHGPAESDAIYVTKVELIQTLSAETNAPPAAAAVESFLLIVTDNATTNRTVIPHVTPISPIRRVE
jgi:hypothetical protein